MGFFVYDSDGYNLITANDSSDCESQDGSWQIGWCIKIAFTKQ